MPIFVQNDIKLILKDGGNVEAANKLVYGGKQHGPSFLVGRVVKKKKARERLQVQVQLYFRMIITRQSLQQRFVLS